MFQFSICNGGLFECTIDEPPCTADCPGNLEFKADVSPCLPTCDSPDDYNATSCPHDKVPGACVCPPGMVLKYALSSICVSPDECSCSFEGHDYETGDTITRDCTTCTCMGKNWDCESNDCPSTCYAVGAHVYKTFDDYQYHFGGRCGYMLLKTTDGRLEVKVNTVIQFFKHYFTIL